MRGQTVMSRDVVERLRGGIVEYPRRWSGDTHFDKGGPTDYDATGVLMNEAADLIDSLTKERDALRMALLAASALLPAVESDKVLSGTGLIKQLSDDEYIIKERARSLLPKDETE